MNIESKTERLNKLVNKTNSGKSAWEAGKIFSDIKDNKEYREYNYNSFSDYCLNALRISEAKAKNYIKIYFIYDEENITDLILTTHLIKLSDVDHDIRDAIIMAAKIIEKDEVSKQNIPTLFDNSKNTKVNLRPPYNSKSIEGAAYLLSCAKSKGIKIDENKAKTAMEIFSQEKTRKAEFSIGKEKGEILKSKVFPKTNVLFKREPINEQGLVALFCTIFHIIRDVKFEFGKKVVQFSAIEDVREPFPDAEIELKTEKGISTITVEFEYLSQNFISHKHPKCDLVICWINNIKDKKLKDFGVDLPPILSLKELLEIGKIELI